MEVFMSRALKGLLLGASLVVSGAAAAGEPIRLGDAELDGVTAAAATAAGWEILTFANGQRFLPGPFVVADATFAQGVTTGVPGNSTEVDVDGVAETQATPFSSYTLAQYAGTITTEGDGIGRVDPASTATGDFTGQGGFTIPLSQSNGTTEFFGYSWAWAYDAPVAP
jgi:hypothetical protein